MDIRPCISVRPVVDTTGCQYIRFPKKSGRKLNFYCTIIRLFLTKLCRTERPLKKQPNLKLYLGASVTTPTLSSTLLCANMDFGRADVGSGSCPAWWWGSAAPSIRVTDPGCVNPNQDTSRKKHPRVRSGSNQILPHKIHRLRFHSK